MTAYDQSVSKTRNNNFFNDSIRGKEVRNENGSKQTNKQKLVRNTTCLSRLTFSKQHAQGTVLETNNTRGVSLIKIYFFFELKITIIDILGGEP